MAQKVLFTMDYLNVSQGYGVTTEGISGEGTYSHSGMKALDIKGKDTGIDPFYAPFDCTVKRISPQYNIVYFQSNAPVQRRDGLTTYVCFRCMHISDANLAKLGIAVGKTFKQGEICYYEGIKGGATGNHVHVEFGSGLFTGSGSYLTNKGHYSINNPVFFNQICWVPAKTTIINGGGYSWVRETEDSSGLKAGDAIVLTNDTLYTASTGNIGSLKVNSTYYIYDGIAVNGRYRVCSSIANVGKGLAYVSGWVQGASTYSRKAAASATTTNASSQKTLAARTAVTLSNKMLYTTSTGTTGVLKKSATYYIYDGKLTNGRYRVCAQQNYCGKGMAYVAGWITATDV